MKKNKPVLSVILPVYNSEKYISETIISILNQTFSDFELIICDDGSIDNSAEIIRNFKDERITFLKNKKNLGKMKTVNNALPLIKGKYFTVHDSDDVSMPERFLKQIEFLEDNKHIAMCGTSFLEMDEKGKFLVNHYMPSDIEEIKKTQSFPNGSNFHGPTLIIKSSIIDEVGGFYREHFKKGEDIEFCTRVCEKYDATNLEEILYKYRLHDKSLTKSVNAYEYYNVAHIEFGKYLQKERREKGIDLYLTLDKNELEKIFEKYLLKAKRERGNYYKLGVDRSVYFGYFKNAFILNLRWIKKVPFDYRAYKYLANLLYQYSKKIL